MYAGQELSIELYGLSGWEEQTFDWWGENKTYLAPRYSLGYLLRKLPNVITERGETYLLYMIKQGDGSWHVCYGLIDEDGELVSAYRTNADTPEDAACKLAIELFKQGVLK